MRNTTLLATESKVAMIDLLINEIADRVVARLAEQAVAPHTHYASARVNPLGSPRAFLDAARANAFPNYRRGRNVVARWCDVEAWIESRRRPARERVSPDPGDDDRALLKAAGVQPRRLAVANDRGRS